MVTAKFYCTGDTVHMELDGHAGSGPAGQDLVCAACSALACTLAEAVERMYHRGLLRRCPRVELESGRAEVIAVPKKRFLEPVLMVFWAAEVGFCLLAEGQTPFVRVEETMLWNQITGKE